MACGPGAMRPKARSGRSALIPRLPAPISTRPAPVEPRLAMTSRGALANDRKSGREAIGRSRGGLTTKIHLAADQRCRPVARLTTPGQHGDCPQFIPLMNAIRYPAARSGQATAAARPGDGRQGVLLGRATAPGCGNAASRRSSRSRKTRRSIAATGGGPAGGRPSSTPAGTPSATPSNAASASSSSSARWPRAMTSASGFTRAPSTLPRSGSGCATPSHDPRDTP